MWTGCKTLSRVVQDWILSPGLVRGSWGGGEEEEEEATEMGKASGSWKKKSRESCPAGQKKKAQMTSLETGMNAFKE